MQVTSLERAVVERLFHDPELRPLSGALNFEHINVLARDFTGVGFLTELEPSHEVKLFTDAATFRWGKVGARLNTAKIEAAYVLYVDNGYLNSDRGLHVRGRLARSNRLDRALGFADWDGAGATEGAVSCAARARRRACLEESVLSNHDGA